jgi:hypothetical protein
MKLEANVYFQFDYSMEIFVETYKVSLDGNLGEIKRPANVITGADVLTGNLMIVNIIPSEVKRAGKPDPSVKLTRVAGREW